MNQAASHVAARKIFQTLGIVGEQNLLPQNVSLACSLFQGENNQGSKDWKRASLVTQ